MASASSSASASTAKQLRVGLIQGGKIIDEKLVKATDGVTVGQDARNTFIVPVSGLPATFAVFERMPGHYQLVFTEQMDGRVRVDGKDVELTVLRAQNIAKKRGQAWVLPLTEQSKGKVTLGEITLLFQFVAPPPAPRPMELPADIKGTLWSGMDRVFFTVLAASLFLHLSGATCVILSPAPPADVELDTIPDRFAQVLTPPKPVEPEKPKEEAKQDEAKKEEKKEPTKKEQVASADPVQRKAQIEKKVAAKGLLKVLGANGGASGALADVLGGSTGAGDIAEALHGAAGVNVADANTVGGPRGGGSGKQAGIGDLGTTGGGNVNLGNKSDAKVSGRVAEQAPEVDSADVDRDALARYVKARLKSIQACYEGQLKRNPSLKGKVTVRFSIMTTGRAGNVEIEENTLGNEQVGACIRNLIRVWMFPFKPSGEVPVSYPFVFSPAS